MILVAARGEDQGYVVVSPRADPLRGEELLQRIRQWADLSLAIGLQQRSEHAAEERIMNRFACIVQSKRLQAIGHQGNICDRPWEGLDLEALEGIVIRQEVRGIGILTPLRPENP